MALLQQENPALSSATENADASSSSLPSSSSSLPPPSAGLHKQLSRKKSVLFAFEKFIMKDRKTHEKYGENEPLCDGMPLSDMLSPRTPRIPAALRTQQTFRLLGVHHLIGITFFAVTSGPFGFEGTVGAVGPVLMQIGLLLFQVLWSAPLALMTAELSCMIPLTGIAALVLMVAVLSPFAAMVVWGLPRLNFKWIHGQTPKNINWGKFITLLLWNSSGFDGAGNIASEVENPASSYPRALAASVILILAVYGLPTLIGVSVLPDYNEWKSGAYMNAAKLIGGHPLQIWMGLSEVFSALGLLLTRICINSRVIYGMSLVEQVPVFTWLHRRFGTPWIAILATSILTLLLAEFNFYSLAEADMLFYALSTMLKFGALVQLRFTEPDAFRPFWIPLSRNILAAMTIIPIGLCLSMLYFASYRSQVIGLIGMIAAVLGYLVKELLPQYGKQAEEAVQQRVARVQQNIDRMQQWIDLVIAKEFKALHYDGSSSSHGLELSAKDTSSNVEFCEEFNTVVGIGQVEGGSAPIKHKVDSG